MVKRILILFLCLYSLSMSAQAPYTFECITNGGLTGDSCDVCPSTIIYSRSFNGLLIYQDSIPWKWIDQPYSVRVKPGNIVEYWEHGANPYSERVSVSLGLTNFFTTVGMADSTFCNGTTPPDRRPLFIASDSVNMATIKRGDTITIVGWEPIYVVFDAATKKYVISIDTTGFTGGGGGPGTVTSIAATAPAAGFDISGSPITTSGTFVFSLDNDLAGVEGLSGTGFAVRTATDTWATRSITSGTGISVSNGDGVPSNPTIINTAPDQVVTIVGSTGTYPNFTVNDASATNEGSLSVGAGGANSSTIVSNTSGSTPVTISGSNGILVTESGSTISIAPPVGTDRQTLRYNSSGVLLADSEIQNNGTEVGINIAPVSGTELYVNGFTRVDGTIASVGTGTATGTTTSPTVRLINTTATTGDTWYLHSANNGEFQLHGGNSSETMVAEPDGTIFVNYDFGIGLLAGTPTKLLGANASGIVGELTLGSGITISSGTLNVSTGTKYQTWRDDGTPATQQPNANFVSTARISTLLTNDGPNTETEASFDIVTNSIGNAQLRQGAAKSVIGVTGNATANVADIAASAADQVLVVNGANTALSFATVNTGGLTNDAVTYAKLQNIAANNVVLGNILGTNQNAQELTAANLQTLGGFLDGNGYFKRLAWWNDANTVTQSEAFYIDSTTDRLTIAGKQAGTGANNAWLNLNGGSISGTTEAFRGSANISGLFTGIIANASNASSGAASLEVSVGGTSAGDPFFKSTVTSGTSTVFGSDNSATGDPFRITPGGTAPGSTADKGVTVSTDANTLVGINKDAPVYELDVSGTNGRARANQFIGINGKWNSGLIAFGTGAGTAGTPVLNGISGPSNAFQITFTTGTTPAASSTIFTATFPTAFPIGPTYTVFSSRSQTASTDIAKFVVQASSDTAITFQSVGTLTAATQYSLTFFTFGN